MSKTITLSINPETRQRFTEIAEILEKKKSQLFREFVNYFYKRKDNLSNGIKIIEV